MAATASKQKNKIDFADAIDQTINENTESQTPDIMEDMMENKTEQEANTHSLADDTSVIIEPTTVENTDSQALEQSSDNTEHDVPTNKRKRGRPVTRNGIKPLSVHLSTDLYDDVEAAALILFKGNKNAYITSLIEKDVESNRETIIQFKEFMNLNSRV